MLPTPLSQEKMLQIRKANTKDLLNIFKFTKNESDLNWSKETLLYEIKNNFCLAACMENKLIGFISATFIDNIEAQITAIVIKKDYRQKKIGTKLMKKIIDFAFKKNINTFILEVNENNNAALKFYQKNGFQLVGERKGYYGEGRNALILKYSL